MLHGDIRILWLLGRTPELEVLFSKLCLSVSIARKEAWLPARLVPGAWFTCVVTITLFCRAITSTLLVANASVAEIATL